MPLWSDINIATGVSGVVSVDGIGVFLFVSSAFTAEELKFLDASSDIATLITDADLKKVILAAQVEGGQSWNAYLVGFDGVTSTFEEAIDSVIEQINVEAIVLCDAVTLGTEIDDIKAKITALRNLHYPFGFMAQVSEIVGVDYDAYVTASLAIVAGKTAEWLSITAPIFGNELGVLAGSMSKIPVQRSVGRRKTGVVVGLPSRGSWPAGLQVSHFRALSNAGFTTPHVLPGDVNTYWNQAHTFDPASDFKYFEHVRAYAKAERLIYLKAKTRLNDDDFEPDTAGLEELASYVSAPVQRMVDANPKELEAYEISAAWDSATSTLQFDVGLQPKGVLRLIKFTITLKEIIATDEVA